MDNEDQKPVPQPNAPGTPPEPTRRPDPNVVPPAPVLVQEGYSPGKEIRRPNPNLKAPALFEVQMFEEKVSKSDRSEKKEK